MKNFTTEQTLAIIKKYTIDSRSMASIGKDYNVSKGVIKRILQENKIEVRKTNHKYTADYRMFEYVDSKEKAYWLGFIAADGCIYSREQNASVIISLQRKDKEHLQKFKTFMKSNVRILDFVQDAGFSNNTQMSKIVFNSKQMAFDLIDKGIVPRKSLILKPPMIEEQYWLPYIKGYFDGNGCIRKTNQNNNYSISFLGTKEVLSWILLTLEWTANLEKRNKEEKNNYYIRCGGTEKPLNIISKFYKSTEICLDRKQKLYNELQTVVLSRNTKR